MLDRKKLDEAVAHVDSLLTGGRHFVGSVIVGEAHIRTLLAALSAYQRVADAACGRFFVWDMETYTNLRQSLRDAGYEV